VSDTSQGPDWWLASDGKWYPPQSAAHVPAPALSPVQVSPAQRVGLSVGRRTATDYEFSYWTALGWTVLSFGIYGIYVFYQLFRRMREHNQRRLELLEAANLWAWEEAHRQGVEAQLLGRFETVAGHLEPMRYMTGQVRDPVAWTIFYVIGSWVATLVGFVLLDGDLVDHGRAETDAEAELTEIYRQLGRPLGATPVEVETDHRNGWRVAVTFLTFGLYLFWWYYDMMGEPNRHFRRDWQWEDALLTALGDGS